MKISSSIVKKRKRRQCNDDNDPPKRWSDVPNDLLESIEKRLFYTDQLNFGAVCKSWSCIEEEEIRLIQPLQQMPWILAFERLSGILIDPKYKKTYRVDTKSIKKKMNITTFYERHLEFQESKYGWLLISLKDQNSSNSASTTTNTKLFLYSPFLDDNNNCIELPILSTDICMATFTSNPLDDDCTVVTLNTSCQVDAMVIKTYHPSRHSSSWDSQVFKCYQFSPSDVKRWIYTDEGIFYYVIRDGRVGTFNLAREEWEVFPPLPTTMQETLQRVLRADYTNLVRVYMMKSGEGELFLISECNLSGGQSSPWRYNVQYIYRLDLSSMIWKDLNSIGNRVLFIGDGYKAILNSSVLKTKGGRKGISNAIYCCSAWEWKYCTVHDYTLRNSHNGYPRKQQCSRHYGHNANDIINCYYRKMLIDPPLSRRPSA